MKPQVCLYDDYHDVIEPFGNAHAFRVYRRTPVQGAAIATALPIDGSLQAARFRPLVKHATNTTSVGTAGCSQPRRLRVTTTDHVRVWRNALTFGKI